MMISSLLARLIALPCPLFLPAGPQEAPPAPSEVLVESLELTLDFSSIEDLDGQLREEGQRLGSWKGKFQDAPVRIDLIALSAADGFEFGSPAEVTSLVGNNRGNQERKNAGAYVFEISKPLTGSFGHVPYGWLASHDTQEGTRKNGYEVMVAGVTQTAGYFLDIEISGRLSDADWEAFEAFATEVVDYHGAVLDPNWTDEEAEARWKAQAPDDVFEKGNVRVLRSDYYIIFTNLGGGTARSFVKAVDENYEKVRSVFPFEDLPGQRLLPIFYFVQRDQYLDWCVKNLGWDREQASRSGGVATGDVYSTYHQAVGASVHIHEQTHQIFRNRLQLSGGGSWFQEGVAEYMSVKPAELGEVKRFAQKGRTVPLEEFMVVPSLLMSASKGSRKEGGSAAGGAYTQAAAIIEFAKHSKFGSDKFLDWIHAMGKVGRGDLPAIKRGISDVYGVSLEEFETEFIEYWKTRRKVKGWHAPAPSEKKRKR